jgi:hypothetical protein
MTPAMLDRIKKQLDDAMAGPNDMWQALDVLRSIAVQRAEDCAEILQDDRQADAWLKVNSRLFAAQRAINRIMGID